MFDLVTLTLLRAGNITYVVTDLMSEDKDKDL